MRGTLVMLARFAGKEFKTQGCPKDYGKYKASAVRDYVLNREDYLEMSLRTLLA